VAKANLQESRSNLRNAKREFERVKVLRKKKIASESDLDDAEARYLAQEAQYKVGLAQIAQKEAALKAAEVRLSYTRIQADWENDGSRVVGERFVDEGAMLGAHDAIVSILDIRSLIAVVYVIERDYNKIQLGQKALITTDAFPDRRFQGEVIRIAPLIKEQSRQARVEIKIPNPMELLKPGMFVRVQIEFAEHEQATVIPVVALCKRDGRQGVFLVDFEQAKVRFVPVTLGVVQGDRAQVINPPLAGSVVTLGQHLLSDGSSVILPNAREQRPSSAGADTSRQGASSKPGERS
jgi:RND family efflux transporter MFP subunit